MNILENTIVKDVVKRNFKAAQIFQAHNIDYCCGGNIAITEACQKKGINQEKLISQLNNIVAQTDEDTEYINSLSLAELSDHIVKRHHAYVREQIPFLEKNLEKIARVHGKNHPELAEIQRLFHISAGEFTMHMQKEELMLFPYIKRLEAASKTSSSLPKAQFGSVANPIAMMMSEHQNEGDRFSEISKLTDNYSLPNDGCTTYEVTFKQLEEFEQDLHRHIHLENNILFPAAVELEKQFYREPGEENYPKLVTLQNGAALKVLEVTGGEGMQMPLHYSTQEAVIIVQEGSAVLNINNQKHQLTPGNTFVIPAWVNHTLTIETAFKAVVIMELNSKIEFAK